MGVIVLMVFGMVLAWFIGAPASTELKNQLMVSVAAARAIAFEIYQKHF